MKLDIESKLFSIQSILLILVLLIVLNIITIILQTNMTDNVVTIKSDHLKSNSEICDTLVRRYERRAIKIAYQNMNPESFMNIQIRNTSDIPIEDIIHASLSDKSVIPVAYFDEKGFLQTLFLPKSE